MRRLWWKRPCRERKRVDQVELSNKILQQRLEEVSRKNELEKKALQAKVVIESEDYQKLVNGLQTNIAGMEEKIGKSVAALNETFEGFVEKQAANEAQQKADKEELCATIEQQWRESERVAQLELTDLRRLIEEQNGKHKQQMEEQKESIKNELEKALQAQINIKLGDYQKLVNAANDAQLAEIAELKKHHKKELESWVVGMEENQRQNQTKMGNLLELVATCSQRIEGKVSVDQFLLLQSDRDALRDEFVGLEQNQLLNQQKQQQNIVDHFSRLQTTIGELEHKQKDDRKETNELLKSVQAKIVVEMENQKLSNDHKFAEMEKLQKHQQHKLSEMEKLQKQQTIAEMEKLQKHQQHKLSEMEKLQKHQQQTIAELDKLQKHQQQTIAELDKLQKQQQQTIAELTDELENQKLSNDPIKKMHARQVIVDLVPTLATTSEVILDNLFRIKEKQEAISKCEQQMNTAPTFETVQFVPLQHLRTVCTSDRCTEVKKTVAGEMKLFKRHCHPHCDMENIQPEDMPNESLKSCWAFDGQDKCRVCGCDWSVHMHIRFDQVVVTQELDEARRKQPLADKRDTLSTLEAYRLQMLHERAIIFSKAALFYSFLKTWALDPYNDIMEARILLSIQDAERIVAEIDGEPDQKLQVEERLKGLKESLRLYKKQKALIEAANANAPNGPIVIKADEVPQFFEELCKLPFFGDDIKQMYKMQQKTRK